MEEVGIGEGTTEGTLVGTEEGLKVGVFVGKEDGTKLGTLVGAKLGFAEIEGRNEGSSVGGNVGISVGLDDGPVDGVVVGVEDGVEDGRKDQLGIILRLGPRDGFSVSISMDDLVNAATVSRWSVNCCAQLLNSVPMGLPSYGTAGFENRGTRMQPFLFVSHSSCLQL